MFVFWLIIVALVVTIALGFVTKLNAGFYGFAFAFLIGTFVLKISINELLSFWPVRIMFLILTVNLFFNFASINGAMEKLAMSLLWKFRSLRHLWPLGLILVTFVVCVMGSGFFATIAMLSPIAYIFAKKTRMNPLPGQIIVVYMSSTGGEFFTTSTGAIVRGLLADIGFEASAITYTFYNMFAVLLLTLLYILIAWFISRKFKFSIDGSGGAGEIMDIEKPEPFDKKQKTTLALIIVMMLLLVIPFFLSTLFPGNKVFLLLTRYMDVGFLAIIFSIIAALLKLADEKTAIKLIPWNIILLISGISMLVAIATKMGVVKALTDMVGSSGSMVTTAVLITFIAGIMSVFSSANGVVFPTLFPAIPTLSAAAGLPVPFLMACIVVGALSTGISPMSTAGGLSMGASPNDSTSDYMYKSLWIFPLAGHLLVLIFVGIITAIFVH
jgi:di/tricarboxylate transporter